MTWHINNEYVTDPTRCPQTSTGARHRPHELVSMQTALHQQFALSFMHQPHGLCGRRLTIACVHDVETTDIEVVLARDGGDPCGRPDQGRNDNALLRGLQRASQ